MNRFLLLIIICSILIGCDDIFMDDISDENIEIIAPVGNAYLNEETVSFVWGSIEGAQNYQLVVVSPAFNNIQSFKYDTITEDYKLKLMLPPGSYEWSIKGYNSAYNTHTSYGKFTIKAHE